MTEEPGSERWNWLAEGNAKQARKRVTVDVLLRDQRGKFLLVDPSYKEGWDLPGGMSESNEPPTVTAKREITEELSLPVELGRLLVVEWTSPHGPWDDLVTMIFDSINLTAQQAEEIKPVSEELSRVGFFVEQDAHRLLPPRVANRFMLAVRALDNASVEYFENNVEEIREEQGL